MDIRRSFLYIPGSRPNMVQNGGLFGADVIILDLEDAVAPAEKDAARFLVGQALGHIDYEGAEVAVRINSLDTYAQQDIEYIVPHQPDILVVPKVNSAADIQTVAAMVEAAEGKGHKPIKLIAIIETPLGVVDAFSIAKAHPRLVGIMFGAEDFATGMGAQRTKGGNEIYTARTTLVLAAAAAGVQSYDAVFTDVDDEDGLVQDTMLSRQLGYTGKPAINPRQVKTINSIFSPSAQEIDWAQRVIAAARKAAAEGAGAVALEGKMIDAPIVVRAERIVEVAQTMGLVKGGAR